jgi:hypothetical protein
MGLLAMPEDEREGSVSVDVLLKGDEIGVVLAKEFREVHQFASIAGEASELGKEKGGDVAASNICKHRVVRDGR